MISHTTQLGSRTGSVIDELDLELLLLDSEWIDAEFATIMIASGFADRIIAGLGQRPLGTAGRKTPLRGADHEREVRPRHGTSRVRSPPRHG